MLDNPLNCNEQQQAGSLHHRGISSNREIQFWRHSGIYIFILVKAVPPATINKAAGIWLPCFGGLVSLEIYAQASLHEANHGIFASWKYSNICKATAPKSDQHEV
jgi:hypothetical protein